MQTRQENKTHSNHLQRRDLINELNQLLSREYNSLTHYIYSSNPYVPDNLKNAYQYLEEIIANERRYAEQLGNIILRLEAIPRADPYNIKVADINYLSFDYLADLLLEEKQDLIYKYEQLLSKLSGYGEIRPCIELILGGKKENLQELKKRLALAGQTQH